MLSEGTAAPRFELPALVAGEQRRVALEEYLGDDVVVLAFYPADFNPACDAESCDLDELDLFTMQKDVTILGISPDSVYSHRAFARQYDLRVPLLSDTDGEVAAEYGVGLVDDIGQRLAERAVVVVDHDGTVAYSWSTDDMTELPCVGEITDALAETGGDDTAFARYRVGHAHYIEGRRAFTSAMHSFRDTEWMMAQHDFQQAREEFEVAADRFDTAVRFVDDESLVAVYEGANEKATALWQAADWLVDSASAYSSGSGSEGQELRDDAEKPLSTVREYADPPDPDEWPPDVDDLQKDADDAGSILPSEPGVEDAALDVDIDDAATAESAPDGGAAGDGTATAAAGDGDDIDDAELAEIQAELAANNPESEPSVEEVTEESTAIVEGPPMAGADSRDSEETTADPAADEAVAGTTADSTDESAGSAERGRDGDGTTAADATAPEAAGETGDPATAGAGTDERDVGVETDDDPADGPELKLELVESDPSAFDAADEQATEDAADSLELRDPEASPTDE